MSTDQTAQSSQDREMLKDCVQQSQTKADNISVKPANADASAPKIEHIDIDGQYINYEVSGDPSHSPLILMHGWGCRLETVRSIATTASLTHRVYNIDFPGFGKSPEPQAIWGVEEYTRIVEAFARALNIQNPVLIGHSFGGRVAILFASRNKVDKVVLVDAAGVKPRRPIKYYLRVYTYKTAKWFVRTFNSRQKADKIIERMRNRRGSADYNSASPTMKAVLSRVVNEDLCHVMPDIKAPTLLVWGEDDTATPLRDAKTMEKLIPDAGLVAFPNAGHYSFLDNPVGFRAVLFSFLFGK